MEIVGSYIQYAAGFDKDDITKTDIERAIKDLLKMDDEHGAFWVGVYGSDTEDYVLEIHKSLTLFGNFGEEENYKIQLKSADLIIDYYDLLINGKIDELREKLKKE